MNELGSLDWETYSAAGFVWDEGRQTWIPPKGAREKGLSAIGSAAYAAHPSTEILTLSYRLPGETQKHRWRPGDPLPQKLFDSLAAGGVFKAHNAMFEFLIWEMVAVPKYGFPSILPWRYQLRCTMATARVNSLPGALGDLSKVLNLPTPKDANGKRLLDRYSVPQKPTKTNGQRVRIRPTDPGEEIDGEGLYSYCDTDLDAEEGAFGHMLPMTDDELYFWWIDQEINWRGLALDTKGVSDCMAVLDQALAQYGDEFRALTGGLNPTQLEATRGWLSAQGVHMDKMDEAALDDALAALPDHPPGGSWPPRRVLEIRQLIGSASVKKLYRMANCVSPDGRLRNLFVHHGARTGRPTGDLVQPLNMPRSGPDLIWCGPCVRPFKREASHCPWCGADAALGKKGKWSAKAVDYAMEIMASRSLELVEWYFGDALLTIAGCSRGLFVAGPGMDLIASDYSAIETVVTAALAGEQWRLDIIAQGIDIYLAGASKITGTPLQVYLDYMAEHGDNHPDRQKIGKVSELACGFGGWIGSYKAFGSTEDDDVIRDQILAWRAASPCIEEMWGGQFRGAPWHRGQVEVSELRQGDRIIRAAKTLPDAKTIDYFGFEGMAIQSILHPGQIFSYAGIDFQVRPHPAGWDAMFVRLLPTTDKPGRELTYHMPQLTPARRPHSRPGELAITYWTQNSNPKYGAMGWVPMGTYGGRLTENIVQATAHDIQRFGIKALRLAGYPVVLHVYDENVAEIPKGLGDLGEFERIMATMPPLMRTWPIGAAGGWRGWRYRKG